EVEGGAGRGLSIGCIRADRSQSSVSELIGRQRRKDPPALSRVQQGPKRRSNAAPDRRGDGLRRLSSAFDLDLVHVRVTGFIENGCNLLGREERCDRRDT